MNSSRSRVQPELAQLIAKVFVIASHDRLDWGCGEGSVLYEMVASTSSLVILLPVDHRPILVSQPYYPAYSSQSSLSRLQLNPQFNPSYKNSPFGTYFSRRTHFSCCRMRRSLSALPVSVIFRETSHRHVPYRSIRSVCGVYGVYEYTNYTDMPKGRHK